MDSPHTRLKLIRPPQTAGLLGWSACCCINSCCCKCISCNSCIVNNENFGNLDIECSHTWFNKPFNATKKVIKSRLTCSQHWLSCICGSELAAAAKIKWCLDSLTLRLQRPEWIYLEKMSQQLCLRRRVAEVAAALQFQANMPTQAIAYSSNVPE